MPKQYAHLSLTERDMNTALRAEHKSVRDIGQALGRSPSTVSRELQRNASPEYRRYLSHRAESRALVRRKRASRRPRLRHSQILSYVRAKLAVGW